MRVQHLQQSSSSRHKLAALLTLFAPGLAVADDSQNVLRQGAAPTGPVLNAPIRDRDKPIRAADHTELVPLADELIDSQETVSQSPRGGSVLPQQTILVVDHGFDGWVPRAGRSQIVSPLVVDPSVERPGRFVPLLRQPLGQGPLVAQPTLGPPLVAGPILTGPSDHSDQNGARIGDGLIHRDSEGSGMESAIKLGQSANSTLKIIPNVLEPVPRTVGLQPEGSAESADAGDSSQPIDRIAMAAQPKASSVDNPEQNEPAAEPTSDELAFGDALNTGDPDGLVPEASQEELAFEGDGTPLEPLPVDESSTDDEPVGEAFFDVIASDTPTDPELSADSPSINPSVTAKESGNAGPAPMEIRKLRLRDDFPGEEAPAGAESVRGQGSRSSAAGAPISLEPLDPSIAKMRVGDVEPRPLSEYESPRSRELVQPPTRSLGSASKNPIQGDTITAEGELVLASGQSAARLALKPHTARLKPMIERTLKYYWDRPEDAAERTHWGMLHSIMVFDRDTQIISRRQRFNAVAWMAGNNPCRNQTLFTQDQYGILPKTGVGLQGHQAQLLAIFGLINVPLNYPVYASKQKFTVNDILQREMRDCKVNTELTFTLIGLSHYTDSDTTWVSGDGQDWSVPRVIQEELGQPIVGAACGGTHRLMGFGHALRRRHAEGKPINGQWERADRYIKDFVNYTWSLQNRDGSMSTAWYEKPEDNGDIDRKIQTTGHMLEMLMTVTPDADLQSPEMIRTVNFMAATLYAERGHEWQVGPKGHALRSLAMYYQRVFGSSTPWRPGSASRSAAASPARSVR
jgi:hypothetical protein